MRAGDAPHSVKPGQIWLFRNARGEVVYVEAIIDVRSYPDVPSAYRVDYVVLHPMGRTEPHTAEYVEHPRDCGAGWYHKVASNFRRWTANAEWTPETRKSGNLPETVEIIHPSEPEHREHIGRITALLLQGGLRNDTHAALTKFVGLEVESD